MFTARVLFTEDGHGVNVLATIPLLLMPGPETRSHPLLYVAVFVPLTLRYVRLMPPPWSDAAMVAVCGPTSDQLIPLTDGGVRSFTTNWNCRPKMYGVNAPMHDDASHVIFRSSPLNGTAGRELVAGAPDPVGRTYAE